MSRAIVLGAGRMGRAAAWDLARSGAFDDLLLVDRDDRALRSASAETLRARPGIRVETRRFDLAAPQTEKALVRLLSSIFDGANVVLSSADYRFHEAATRAAIEARSHLCDLGGNNDVVSRQLALDEEARAAGVTIVPDCGLAPGLACLLGALGVERIEKPESLKIRVGGLPANPKPPLNYKLVFSARGLINEYTEPAEVLRGGEIQRVPSLTEIERVEFPPPFGELEAFHTSGGASTLPKTLRSKVANIEYKTIRYPGHCAAFSAMVSDGLFSEELSDSASPRVISETLLARALENDDTDVVLLRVTVEGVHEGARKRLLYEIVDRHDPETGHSAMARTTAYPAAAVAHLLATGGATRSGVVPGELALPLDKFLEAVRSRGIAVVERWESV